MKLLISPLDDASSVRDEFDISFWMHAGISTVSLIAAMLTFVFFIYFSCPPSVFGNHFFDLLLS